MVLADLPDPVVGGATTAELRATTTIRHTRQPAQNPFISAS
jgi:hypothetical protein